MSTIRHLLNIEGREYEWIWGRINPNNGEPLKPCNDANHK